MPPPARSDRGTPEEDAGDLDPPVSIRRAAFAPSLSLGLALALAGCPTDADDDDSATAEPFEPSLTYRGDVAVLRVGGSAYEMGYQHGSLMGDELRDGAEWIDGSELALLEPLADYYDLLDEAYANSYPDVLDECRGMVDAMDDPLWSMDRCLLLAYGDVVLEVMAQELSAACSQLVARGPATADGELIHARNLDWTQVDYIIDHPTLIVRHPDGGIPSAGSPSTSCSSSTARRRPIRRRSSSAEGGRGRPARAQPGAGIAGTKLASSSSGSWPSLRIPCSRPAGA